MVASGRFALPQYPSKGRMLLLHYEAISGTPNAIRTRDPDIKSIVLYLLSYAAVTVFKLPEREKIVKGFLAERNITKISAVRHLE